MDEPVTNFSEPLDVGATASSSKDRSGGSVRFVDALQNARNRTEKEPAPPVELHLSAAARKYAQKRSGKRDGEPKRGNKSRQHGYPPRTPENGESPQPNATDPDGRIGDD